MGIGVGEARAVLARTEAAAEAVSRVGMEGNMVRCFRFRRFRVGGSDGVGRVRGERGDCDSDDDTRASCSRGLRGGRREGNCQSSVILLSLHIYSISR